MKRSAFAAALAAATLGALIALPAAAKTAKECRAEWTAHKAENQAKGITQKAYVATCRAEDKKEKAAAKKQKKETAKQHAAEKKAAKKTKAESKAEMKKTATGKKTVKECRAEWRANKAANQAKGITEKAYVEQCRAGTAMMPAAAPANAPMKKMSEPENKMTPPAAAPVKRATRSETAPATGMPSGANQYASEGAAKTHCRTGTVVWANLDSKIYHFSGNRSYGHTKKGAYMCETDAAAQGMRAAKNEKHP